MDPQNQNLTPQFRWATKLRSQDQSSALRPRRCPDRDVCAREFLRLPPRNQGKIALVVYDMGTSRSSRKCRRASACSPFLITCQPTESPQVLIIASISGQNG